MLRRGLVRDRTPLVTWLVGTAAVVVLQHVSNRVLRDRPYALHWAGLPYYLDGLVQFDGHRYLQIAHDGYSYHEGVQSTIVWFPLYPLLIRAASNVFTEPIVAGFVVAVLAGGATLVLYWRWLGSHGLEARARSSAFYALALYPYAWFLYGPVYADTVFLAFGIAAFVLVERDQLVLGAMAGALCAATRPLGIAFVPALVALGAMRHGVLLPWADRGGASPAEGTADPGPLRGGWLRFGAWVRLPSGVDRTRIRPSTFAPVLSAVGVLGYAGYLWARFGNPLIFITNEKTFHTGRFPLFKGTFVNRLIHVADTPTYTATITLQALLLLAVALSAGRVARRFGFPYAVLVLATVFISFVGTHDFMGVGRYLLGAFPALAVAGEELARRGPKVTAAVLAGSGLLLAVMAFGYSRSAYLT